MKFLLSFFFLYVSLFADLKTLCSFEADFLQTITDDKGVTLTYEGSIRALKPRQALWVYTKPVEKRVYIKNAQVIVVEPEIEQVLVRDLEDDFDFFTVLESAKKIDQSNYLAEYEEQKIAIKVNDGLIVSLRYKDKFENDVNIVFMNQAQNRELSSTLFDPSYPSDYDVIKE